MQLPIIKDPNQNLMLIQTKWASTLNPVLANALNSMSIISGVNIKSGNNVISHLLNRVQQGWVILDQNAAASFYRYAALNDTVLYLNSTEPCVVSIGVF